MATENTEELPAFSISSLVVGGLMVVFLLLPFYYTIKGNIMGEKWEDYAPKAFYSIVAAAVLAATIGISCAIRRYRSDKIVDKIYGK